MKQSIKHRFRVSADIGGTFTDLVFQDAVSGSTFTGKILSTPTNPAGAVLEGLRSFLPDAIRTITCLLYTSDAADE